MSLWSLVTVTLLPAQPASPRRTASSRFLLVVDTSFSMAPQKAVLCITAHDLIYGGIGNQMKPGDTFSVWTFNQDTDTQQFPLLEWDPERKLFLANQVSDFLNNQPFQKISRLDKALPEILGLTRDSRKLTVFVLSDGLEFFQGTPFDVRINEVYRERSRELRQAGKPFITLLQAMDGQIVGWSVSAAGEPIQISQLQTSVRSSPAVANSDAPPDRRGAAANVFNSGALQPGSVNARNPRVTRPNLIIRSVRPKDEASSSSSPPGDENGGAFAGSSEKTKLQLRVPPQTVEPDSSRLNLALATPIAFPRPANASAPPNTSARPIESPSATSAIAITAPVLAQSIGVKAENIYPAIPVPASTPPATRLENSLAKPEESKPSPELASAASAPFAAASFPKDTPAQPNGIATPGPQTSGKPQKSDGESPRATTTFVPAQADSSSLGKVKREPAIEKSVPTTLHPVPTVPSAAKDNAQEQETPSLDSPTGAQIALVTPRSSPQFQWVYFGLGLASLLTALALIYILTRRARAPQRSSMISRSIERK
ncbi:MAG: hypothetical protein ABI651_11610 [Verrucomicrobiota bacterium]